MTQKGFLKDYPLVSIVTVNYNHSETTIELLQSLSKVRYPNLEVIVVDNASPDDSPIRIKEALPNVILIENPINYGFAAGNNFGIMRARGKYVLLLNNDTIVDENFLEPLVLKLEENPNIGAVSPKIRFYYDPNLIQYAGFTPINEITTRNFALGYREYDKGQYNEDKATAYAHGAAMMVPMEVIKKVGMMSYTFFLYYEEADWCARIKRAGFEIHYVHNSLVFHKESVSTGKESPMKIYYQNRNRIVFMRRNIHGKNFWLALMYQLFVAIPKNSLKQLMKGKITYFYAYIRAINWNISHIRSAEIHENPML